MNTATLTTTDTYYVGRLKSLSRLEKMRIIAVLSNSLLEDEQMSAKTDNWADRFCGAWTDDRTAEEIIADIRESRTANRDIVSLFDE